MDADQNQAQAALPDAEVTAPPGSPVAEPEAKAAEAVKEPPAQAGDPVPEAVVAVANPIFQSIEHGVADLKANPGRTSVQTAEGVLVRE